MKPLKRISKNGITKRSTSTIIKSVTKIFDISSEDKLYVPLLKISHVVDIGEDLRSESLASDPMLSGEDDLYI